MKFTLSTVLFLAFVFDIQGFTWYKPQHPFDKVCLYIGAYTFKVCYVCLFRTALISYGRPTFTMENMKDYGILKVS